MAIIYYTYGYIAEQPHELKSVSCTVASYMPEQL